jgi:G3E family GTPase
MQFVYFIVFCFFHNPTDEFKDAVWRVLESSDAGEIDYLLIETSGVTNPLANVSALEASFGKLYRARLDCVVAVVVRFTGQLID